MNKKAILLLTVLLFSVIPIIKADTEWSNSSFQYRNVYIINSDLIDEKLYDFPVLVYLNSSYISWDRVNDDLSDLRFYNISNNLLSHEIDYFVENDEAYLWVKVPYINNVSDTYFFMYYGCFYAESVENKTDVWSNGYVMVQHMNDVTTSTILDSTSNDNDGTKKAANEPIETDGQIAKAQDFDGSDDIISVGDHADFDPTGAFTLECWIKTTQTTMTDRGLISHDLSAFKYLMYYYNNGNEIQFYVKTASGTPHADADNLSPSLDDGNWHYITCVYDRTLGSNRLKVYVNGELEGTHNGYDEDVTVGDEGLTIGAYTVGSTKFEGDMDEVRYTKNVARSSAWIDANYKSQTLNLISLVNTEFYNSEYLAFSFIAIIITLFSFVMVIIIKEKRK